MLTIRLKDFFPAVKKDNCRLVCDYLTFRAQFAADTSVFKFVKAFMSADKTDIERGVELYTEQIKGYHISICYKKTPLSLLKATIAAKNKIVSTVNLGSVSVQGFDASIISVKIENEILYLENWKSYIADIINVLGVNVLNVTRFDLACDVLGCEGLRNYKLVKGLASIKNRKIKVQDIGRSGSMLSETIYVGSASSMESVKIYDKWSEIIYKSGKMYIADTINFPFDCDLTRVEVRTNAELWAKERKGAKIVAYKSIFEVIDESKWPSYFVGAMQRKGIQCRVTGTDKLQKPLTGRKKQVKVYSETHLKNILSVEIKFLIQKMYYGDYKQGEEKAVLDKAAYFEAKLPDRVFRQRVIDNKDLGCYIRKKIRQVQKMYSDSGIDLQDIEFLYNCAENLSKL